MRVIAIYAAVCLVGCTQNADSAAENEEARDDATAAAASIVAATLQRADSGMLVASLGNDTVRMIQDNGDNKLVWTTYTGDSTITRWVSRSMYSGVPTVELMLVDGDAFPDLFWSLRFEDIIGGMLLIGTATGAREVFLSDRAACAEPMLEDVNNDGRIDIVEYNAGVLATDECSGDALATPCQEEYSTDWAVVNVQTDAGFNNEPAQAPQFYLDRAAEYSRSAEQIRRALAEGTSVSPRCNAEMATGLDSMATRAGELARGG